MNRPEDVPGERLTETEASGTCSVEHDPHRATPPQGRAASTPKIRRSIGRTGVSIPRKIAEERDRAADAGEEEREAQEARHGEPDADLPRNLVVLQHLGDDAGRVALRACTEKTNAPCSGCESAETTRQATVYVPRASGRSSSSITTVCASGREVRPESTRFASES